MSLFSRSILLGVGFVAGYGLHAWAPWADETPRERTVAALAGLDYQDITSNQEFAGLATSFLDGLDGNCPPSPAEKVIAIVMAQDRYGLPYLAGYQISSYAHRYGDALGLLTTYRLKAAPARHPERYARLREALSLLNEREGEYCAAVFGGSGAYRDRRVEHIRVEDFISGQALRLASSPAGADADPRRSFRGLISRLESDQQFLAEGLKGDQLLEYRLKEGARCQREIMKTFGQVMEELQGWPPEVAEGLAPLILQTFQ